MKSYAYVIIRCVSTFSLSHFSATVTNLQAKVEALTTTNALMKEDLAIAKNNILSLQDENRQLKKELGIEVKDANEVHPSLKLPVNMRIAILLNRFNFRMEKYLLK